MKIIKSMLLSASLLSVAATAHDHHEADSPDHRHNAPASALYLGQDPTRIILGQVTADMVRIPHSGWPERMTDVENMAYRVTLNPGSNQARTVLHIGDADTRDQHYAVNAEHWASRPIHMAFPPYWYYTSLTGHQVLVQRLKPIKAVGVHVPASFADDPTRRPPEYSDFDLFTRPGEERQIPNSPP